MKFPVEIIRRIKKVCGNDFPVGFKFNMHMDIKPEGIDEETGLAIARRISEEGVAYLHEVTMGEDVMFMALGKYPSMPTIYQPRNTTLSLAEYIKDNLTGVPVIAAGGILTPEDSEKIITEGKADMVAIGRALLADPHWSLKAKEARRITPCIKCLVCHNEVVKRAKLAACSVNPYLCRENEMEPVAALQQKNVMVIGAGPAGIVAALTASRRGHNVKLYEKNKNTGGMLFASTVPDFKYEFDTLIEFYHKELEESSVEIFLGRKATPETVKQVNPDALVLAIGGTADKPKIKGLDTSVNYSAAWLLSSSKIPEGYRTVVIGGGEVGCETALWLKRSGKAVSIVEILDELMSLEEMKYHTMILERMLRSEEVNIYTGSEVLEIDKNKVKISDKNGMISVLDADFVVYATGFKEPVETVKSFSSLCKEFYVIGDAKEPKKIREAVHEADRIGRLL